MIMFVLLHLHMHLESYLFTNQVLYKKNPFLVKKLKIEREMPIILDYVKIDGGMFWQGFFDKHNKIGFDNEKPHFRKKVKPFRVSKTLITNFMFRQFIESGGYDDDKHWSFQGKYWKIQV